MWVSKRAYKAVVADNAALTARNAQLVEQLRAASDASLAAVTAAAAEVPKMLDLQKELAAAHEQIGRQDKALRAYERDHEELNDELRRLAGERAKAPAAAPSEVTA